MGVLLVCPKYNVDLGNGTFDIHPVWKTFKKPFRPHFPIIIGGTSAFTATESGIIACLYGLVCGFSLPYFQLRFYTILKERQLHQQCL